MNGVVDVRNTLAGYSVDPVRGFLPAEDPLRCLPVAYSSWEDLAQDIPKLLGAGRFREEILKMPQLGTGGLTTEAERNRAMLLLSYLGHAYIYGESEPADTVPAALAQPWHEVATLLGRPPVLSYASHALSNWRRFDPSQPIELGNIARLENFHGGIDEDWFVLVHVAIEGSAGPGLAAAVEAQNAVVRQETAAVTAALTTIGDTLATMLATLRRMPENCDPYIYYHRVRQFIFGWKDNPGLPKGVWFEGVDAYGGEPTQFRGETGAQSSIIPSFDAVLGMDHNDNPLGRHVIELSAYMPPAHREFMAYLAGGPSVRDYVIAHVSYSSLVDAYDRCVQMSADFRRQHLEYAGTYIRAQQQHSSANPVEVGTGGTPFMKYLAQHAKDTQAYLVGQ